MINSPMQDLGFSLIEDQQLYLPTSIARRILNFARSEDVPESLVTAGGMTLYDPHASSFSTRIDGLIHTESYDGAASVTLIRSNTTLYRHQGWDRSYTALQTGLTYNPAQPYPDVMVEINGRVIWSNGIDTPLVIDCLQTSGRLVTKLGFDNAPGSPTVVSPSQVSGYAVDGAHAVRVLANYQGYAVYGKIGSVSEYNGEDGNLLDGAWLYAVQWEDVHGNLSPLSPLSAPAFLTQCSTGYLNAFNSNYKRMNNLDSLTRQFALKGIDKGEDHVAAIRIYRTTDTKHNDGKLYLLARCAGRKVEVYPDNTPDARLVMANEAVEPIATQPFKVGCEHLGRLVTANFNADPAMVRWSQVGFPGTWLKDSWRIPDKHGAVTGLHSYQGTLYVFTRSSMYAMQIEDNGSTIQPVSTTIGCVSPQSIRQLPDGRLIWLSDQGFMTFDGTSFERVGKSISRTQSQISKARAGRTTSAIDPVLGVYLVAFPTQERGYNDRFYSYDPVLAGWTEYGQGIYPSVLAETHSKDGLVLVAGLLDGSNYKLYAWNRPGPLIATSSTAYYDSNILRLDPSGTRKFDVREVYIGFIESQTTDPGPLVFRWYRGDRADAAEVIESVGLVGEDWNNDWNLTTMLLDASTSKYREGTVRWRKIALGSARDLTGFRFSVQMPLAGKVQLLGFRFILETGDKNGSRIAGNRRS